ncbi:TPA: hypothetical protein MND73_000649 [Salmonella enterica subsp. houtenae]|nr:hypothetical protein [Salmonella enterica subsp. houtenae]
MAKSATERKAAQRARLASGGGLRHELVLTRQEARLGVCGRCGKSLPQGGRRRTYAYGR